MDNVRLNAAEMENACMCLGVRRAARLVTRRYDDRLKALGITSGQFSILASLLRDRAVPIGSLAEVLGLERTTLNRNLKPLEASGLVATSHDAKDARVRALRLTQAGRDLVERAVPLWREAQADSNRRLGEGNWSGFRAQLDSLK